ncbi:MAG: 23S rRNA (uracil(1939)-C(5))-methyltransferase RlmD [Ginsengibacter sp.]
MKAKKTIIQNLAITGYAAEGKALGHLDGKVIFVELAVPGDVVDIIIIKSKKDWAEGKIIRFKEYAEERVEPFCIHFGICGGCKWQMLPYENQLEYKQLQAEQNLRRIGKVELPEVLPIIGADEIVYYRNKLEFTFSNKRYLLPEEIETLQPGSGANMEGALGYHAAGIFDKIIDIEECYLMNDINNVIRNTLRTFVKENNLSYYDIKNHAGWLRNIIIRYATNKQLMLNLVVAYEDKPGIKKIADYLLQKIPAITTFLYTINTKWNDSIFDLTPQIYSGKGFIIENIENFHFKISPKSFFQTNTKQAEKLYKAVRSFAELTGKEIIYDLYCGTGSIGIFLSKGAKKIIGVEAIKAAIDDARKNALINDVDHALFFSGDVIKVCTDEFFSVHGKPDVIITDPPRAGMHEKLVNKLLEIEAPKIVYVSCNIATQARDINLLGEKYKVIKIQPIDMFPHTHHIECVCLLELKLPSPEWV